MDDLRPFPEKELRSLCKKRKKVKICVTISEENEEILHALTQYHKYDSYSRIVNEALTGLFITNVISTDIEQAKEDWKKEWAVFRKKRPNL